MTATLQVSAINSPSLNLTRMGTALRQRDADYLLVESFIFTIKLPCLNTLSSPTNPGLSIIVE